MDRTAKSMNGLRILCLVAAIGFAAEVVAQQSPQAATTIVLQTGQLLAKVTEGGRIPLYEDRLQYALLGQNEWPADLDALWQAAKDEGQDAHWQPLEADENGLFAGGELSRGYLAFDVPIEEPGAYLLSASGHSTALVNGQPRTGNPYGSWYQVPVELRGGNNQLLFTVGRGRFQGSLTKLDKRIFLADGDTTLPDWLRGTTDALWAAMPLVNATQQTQPSLTIETQVGKASLVRTNVGPILPMALRKVGFQFQTEASPAAESLDVQVRVVSAQRVLDERTIQVAVRDPSDKHRRTFQSAIDGSVQYFGVVPPAISGAQTTADSTRSEKPALVLTLHGASVEGMGQASVYQPKPEMFIVAPTNRRPFGFDWEDWGRRDALEVLELAQREFNTDPRRTYLTGHSMGGHGTWQVGATFPARFAAIGPSAGWVSFWSYGGGRSGSEQPIGQLLRRSTNGSDTLLVRDNYAQQGVYVLHGDADDNVPVSEARSMRKVLAEFHSDFAYYERPGAGHWWGDQCCDWPPMFEFFRHHQRPAADEASTIDFTTVNPGVSARYEWVTIADQTVPLVPSHVRFLWDRESNQWRGTTNNVARLALDLVAAPLPAAGDAAESTDEQRPAEVLVVLDGQTLTLSRQRHWLSHSTSDTDDDAETDKAVWNVIQPPSRRDKGPHRYGLFKSVFDQNAVLVYGTAGTDMDNAWALAKSRYDAEQFWYRGNGSFEVIPDTEFSPPDYVDRSVVLYGNADTNSAWAPLLADCPVQMTRTAVIVGQNRWDDEQLFMLLVYPRPDSETALVGVVGGTGIEGSRATNLLRYFVSGVAYPDLLLGQNSFLIDKDRAVLAAGFFNSQWGLEAADMVFTDR